MTFPTGRFDGHLENTNNTLTIQKEPGSARLTRSTVAMNSHLPIDEALEMVAGSGCAQFNNPAALGNGGAVKHGALLSRSLHQLNVSSGRDCEHYGCPGGIDVVSQPYGPIEGPKIEPGGCSHIFEGAGKDQERFSVDFESQAFTIAPDGTYGLGAVNEVTNSFMMTPTPRLSQPVLL